MKPAENKEKFEMTNSFHQTYPQIQWTGFLLREAS
jgi:hypothetical protein